MRTKCRCLFQHAAAAASAQCTLGNSQLGRLVGRDPLTPLTRQTLQAGNRFTIRPLIGPSIGQHQSGRGGGSGSECRTVSRDTARVSATYSRCSPLASAPAIRTGSTTIT
jgi:hypothetical protein